MPRYRLYAVTDTLKPLVREVLLTQPRRVSMLSRKQAVTGIVFWLLVFGAFIALSGVGDFVDAVVRIAPTELLLILGAVGVSTVAMGGCLYVLARSIDLGLSPIESVFLNTSVSLAHNLTPFGQAGGAPIGAAILSKRSDGDYEECLAALSAKDIVSFVPAILVFIFGGFYIALYAPTIPTVLRPLLGAFALFVTGIVAAVYGVRRYPENTRAALHRVVGGCNAVLARLPRLPSLNEDDVEGRVQKFADSVGDVAADRPTIILASALATTAFLAQGVLLWLTLGAVGIEVPLALAIFTVPVSLLASGLPLPGGSGGVESVQILVIGAMTAAQPAAAIPAVVLSRGLVYWTPIVLGSLTLFGLQLQDVRPS
jgi:uncharacterized protein (TIRG00374 family)